MSKLTILASSVVVAMAGHTAHAVNIQMVAVGNPGNANDIHGDGYGGLDYIFSISKFEVTASEYTEFLNAIAETDTHGLYALEMGDISFNPGPRGCNIQRDGSSGNYSYSVAADWANRPVNYVSWGDVARFANWLHNGQPTGPQDLTTTEDGSYYLNGATSEAQLMVVIREPDATSVIPSEDEWYKAAYHYNDGMTGNYFDYPTSNDSVPSNELIDPDPGNNANFPWIEVTLGCPYHRTVAGEFENSESPYGTFDQGGNVFEWNEGVLDGGRLIRGGSLEDWGFFGAFMAANFRHSIAVEVEDFYVGFRVVSLVGVTGIYVDQNATGPIHDGTSWCNAFLYLQDALAVATTGITIQVADGTYRPDQGVGRTLGDNFATFQLVSGVAVEGGYAGCNASNPDDRNIAAFETILSGDLLGDDGSDFSQMDDNSIHVVKGVSGALIDGFTITRGNALLDNVAAGGGMLNSGASPTVANCMFFRNIAERGGGMSNRFSSSPTITSCTFLENAALRTGGHPDVGGAIHNEPFSNAVVTDCFFSGNTAEQGGAVYIGASTVTIERCIFSSNSAVSGGAVFNGSNDPGTTHIVNCLFLSNSASSSGAGHYSRYSDTISNSTFAMNTAPSGRAIATVNLATLLSDLP